MIVGVDIGTRSAHLACFDPLGALLWVESFQAPKMDSRGAELTKLMGLLVPTIGVGQVKTYIEEPPSAGPQNKRTFMQLGQTCGALLATASHGYLVPVSAWKKEIIGSGNASKDDVSAWLEAHVPAYHAACGSDQNRTDAVAIGLYGVLTANKASQLRDLAIS